MNIYLWIILTFKDYSYQNLCRFKIVHPVFMLFHSFYYFVFCFSLNNNMMKSISKTKTERVRQKYKVNAILDKILSQTDETKMVRDSWLNKKYRKNCIILFFMLS